jgi:hypothetical protein
LIVSDRCFFEQSEIRLKDLLYFTSPLQILLHPLNVFWFDPCGYLFSLYPTLPHIIGALRTVPPSAAFRV